MTRLALTLGVYLVALPALANDMRIVVPRISTGEFQNQQNRQQRQQFRQRQQINSELDSLSNQRLQPRIEVPVMKPSCRPQQLGISC